MLHFMRFSKLMMISPGMGKPGATESDNLGEIGLNHHQVRHSD
jgi:hypothetical protein